MTATVHELTPVRGYKKATTAEIKKALVKKFNHKFSVTRDRGTASRWISVRWTDGPTESQVRGFCSAFNDTKNDDMMTDLWCGSQYTSESRDLSMSAMMFMAARVAKKFGLPKPRLRLRCGYRGHKYLEIPDEFNPRLNDFNYDRFSDLVHREAYKFDFNAMKEVEG